MTGWFVGLNLFVPRLALLGYYLMGYMPANDTSFTLDAMMFVFAPRLLVAWWLWQDPSWHPLWSVLFVVFWFGAMGSGGNKAKEKSSARTRRHSQST